MTSTTRKAEQCSFHVDPASLVATDRSLVVDGAGDDGSLSIHLMFAPSERESIELFHCDHPDGELLAVNGVLDSKLRVPLIAQVLDQHMITLMVRDTNGKVPLHSEYPPELEPFSTPKSA